MPASLTTPNSAELNNRISYGVFSPRTPIVIPPTLRRTHRVGDSRAFWLLWSQNEPDLYRVCLAQMDGNQADAEDALATMRLKAFEALSTMAATINTPRSWLIRSTRNLCRDIRRGTLLRTRHAIQIDHLQQEVADPRKGILPEPIVVDCDSHARLRSFIDRLPSRLRDAALFRFVEEMEYDQIAGSLEITEANARKRVQESRTYLKRAIREAGMHDLSDCIYGRVKTS